MDRTTARSLVASKIEDPDQTKFTATQYNTALDIANQQFCIDGRALIESTSVTLVAGQAEYTLPTDFLVMIMARANGIKLNPTTKYELSFQAGQDWTTLPNGQPSTIYMDEQNGKFGVVPAPDGTNAALPFTLDYIGIPTAMSADTGSSGTLLNNVTILQYYAMGVVSWAAREMLTYVPQTAEIDAKRRALFEDYQRYFNQLVETYNNMVDEPLRMRGGQVWQDTQLLPQDNAFSG